MQIIRKSKSSIPNSATYSGSDKVEALTPKTSLKPPKFPGGALMRFNKAAFHSCLIKTLNLEVD